MSSKRVIITVATVLRLAKSVGAKLSEEEVKRMSAEELEVKHEELLADSLRAGKMQGK